MSKTKTVLATLRWSSRRLRRTGLRRQDEKLHLSAAEYPRTTAGKGTPTSISSRHQETELEGTISFPPGPPRIPRAGCNPQERRRPCHPNAAKPPKQRHADGRQAADLASASTTQRPQRPIRRRNPGQVTK